MKNGESKISHLQMIQDVITRMGNNSFSIKGWTSAIIIALYALVGEEIDKSVIIVSIIPTVVMWILDTYYLVLEKKFRKLYDDVRQKDEEEIDFNMNFNSLKITLAEMKKYSFFNTMFSISILPFYMVCMIVTLIVFWR